MSANGGWEMTACTEGTSLLACKAEEGFWQKRSSVYAVLFWKIARAGIAARLEKVAARHNCRMLNFRYERRDSFHVALLNPVCE